MRFMLLLYGDPEAEQSLPAEERTAIVQRHSDFDAKLRSDGVYVYGDALDGPETARVPRPDR